MKKIKATLYTNKRSYNIAKKSCQLLEEQKNLIGHGFMNVS